MRALWRQQYFSLNNIYQRKIYHQNIMAISQVPRTFSLLLLLLYFGYAAGHVAETIPACYDAVFLNRSSFPADFIFGTASSSYQVILIY